MFSLGFHWTRAKGEKTNKTKQNKKNSWPLLLTESREKDFVTSLFYWTLLCEHIREGASGGYTTRSSLGMITFLQKLAEKRNKASVGILMLPWFFPASGTWIFSLVQWPLGCPENLFLLGKGWRQKRQRSSALWTFLCFQCSVEKSHFWISSDRTQEIAGAQWVQMYLLLWVELNPLQKLCLILNPQYLRL